MTHKQRTWAGRPRHFTLIGVLLSFSWGTPSTTSFQTSILRQIIRWDHTNPPSRSLILSVAQNDHKPEVESSFVFFNDFDYDHYQTVDEAASAVQEDSMIPSESMLHCAIDPTYDLSTPYTSRTDSKSTFVEYTSDGLCVPSGPIGAMKEEIANLLKEPAVEIIIASVILLNALLVALSTFESLNEFMPMILFAEIVVSTIFVVDFAARWFSSDRETGKFILDPQFGIDVLVVILPLVVTITPDSIRDDVVFLPSALSKPSELFNLRLLRVLRLQRFLRDLDTFERFVEQVSGSGGASKVQEWQLKLARVVSSLFTLLSVVSGLIYTAENAVNPNISNYFDALYFSLTTRKCRDTFLVTASMTCGNSDNLTPPRLLQPLVTTVGFGDVSPVTWQGKLIVCASIVLGVAIVPAQAASLVDALLDREGARNGKGAANVLKASIPRPDSRMATTFNNNGDSNKEMLALDTSMSCPRCGARFHWSSAQFCYSCGEEL
jgi:hypothetical protein